MLTIAEEIVKDIRIRSNLDCNDPCDLEECGPGIEWNQEPDNEEGELEAVQVIVG